MASVRDIAKRAGVSITTVSRVLNNHPYVSSDVREKVLAAANQSRYVATVGKRSTNNIALIYTDESTLGSPFDAGLLDGISQCMEEVDYDLMIMDARRARQPGETYTQLFMRKGVRGVLLRTTAATRTMCEAIAGEGFPVMVVGDRFENPAVNFIYSESKDTSREAIEHLIGLGHQRILACVNVVDDTDHSDRLQGYLEALESRGMEVDRRLIWRVPANREGGSQLIKRIIALGSQRPTAAFITDPLAAVVALCEAWKAGLKVPRDLSIVGVDDAEIRYTVFPEMTAVCQDSKRLGREAFSSLRGLIERDESAGPPAGLIRKSLRTWLEVRGSSGPAPQ